MLDIIICKGNNWIDPPEPLLYGSRNTELNQVSDRYNQLEMVDLDWEDCDWNEYKKQLIEVRKAKDNPIKYVVIPDLEDKRDYLKTIRFAYELKNKDIFEIGLLPVKINIDLNILPDFIRPALPVLTGYKKKALQDMDLTAFKDYEGEIHTLGGSHLGLIISFAQEYAPRSKLASIDFNKFTHLAYYGMVFTKYCLDYHNIISINKDKAMEISYNKLLETVEFIEQIGSNKIDKLYENLLGDKALIETTLEEYI